VEFLNIPNIHAVRESYNKAVKAALGEDSRFYINLAESEWYDYVFLIIEGAIHVAKSLNQGKNVLVHCSDGWDRTSQLCALAQILLDPYYRTIVGFQNLIDKDWVRFGHQFAIRMGQGVNNPNG
jgi:protein tyrosine phosphatase